MKVTFLGTGSAFSRSRSNANLLVEVGELKVLIDCGFTACRQLEALGLSVESITHIVVTHLHADHVGGLEEVAIRARLQYKTRPILISSRGILDRLWDCSLRGGLEFLEETPGQVAPQSLTSYFGALYLPPDQLTAIADDFSIQLCTTYHVKGMESYGLLVEGVGKGGKRGRFFFSGDTRFDPGFIEKGLAFGGRMFHDCQLEDIGPNNSLSVHTSYNQLLSLPKDSRKALWLYHYGDEPRPNAKAGGFKGFVSDLQSFEF